MAQSILELILRTRRQGQGVDDAAKDLKKLDEQVDKSHKGLSILDGIALGLGTRLLDMGASALRAIPDLVEMGVEIQRAETALTAYAGSAYEAERVTLAVQDAAGGSLSKFDAMRNAARLMAMGLAQTADDAEKLTRIAVTLGATMGVGPQEAFENFSLLLANTSIPRLDTFGLSAAAVRDEMARLQEQTEGLDRQTAFLNAVQTIGSEKLEDLAAAGFEAASSIDRLKAIIADTKADLATTASDGLIPFIDKLVDFKEANDDALMSIAASVDTVEEFRNKARDTAPFLLNMRDSMIENAIETAKLDEALRSAIDVQDGWLTALTRSTLATEEQTEATVDLEAIHKNLQSTVQGKLGPTYTDFIQKNTELEEKITTVTAKIAELEGKSYLTRSQREELDKAYTELDELKEQVSSLADTHDEATARILFDILTQRAALEGLTSDEVAFITEIATSWGLIDQATATAFQRADLAIAAFNKGEIETALFLMDEILKDFDSIPDSITTDINIRVRAQGVQDEELQRLIRRLKEDIPIPRQLGGPVSSNQLYIVGEHGPELFVPHQSGTVIAGDRIREIVNNYYNLAIHSMAPVENVRASYDLMRAWSSV